MYAKIEALKCLHIFFKKQNACIIRDSNIHSLQSSMIHRKCDVMVRYSQWFFCDGTRRYGVPENLTTG